MSLHTETVPVARESASREAASSAALGAWLSSRDFPDMHSRGIDGITPLMLASLHGEDRMVAALLTEGARIDALDDDGNHALWYACLGGAPAPILRLIEAGIAIDHANDDDITCLMQAAASGRVEVMQLLLSFGASEAPSAPDGRSALDMAADRGFELLRTAHRLDRANRAAPAADLRGVDCAHPAIETNVFADKAA